MRIDRNKLRNANEGWRYMFVEGYAAGMEDADARRVVGPRWHRLDDYGCGYRAAMRLYGYDILQEVASNPNHGVPLRAEDDQPWYDNQKDCNMSNEIAKPGDIIVITRQGSSYENKKCVVVKCPSDYVGNSNYLWTWFSYGGGDPLWTIPENYKIVNRANGQRHSQSTTDVDERLRQLRDANLRRAFTGEE